MLSTSPVHRRQPVAAAVALCAVVLTGCGTARSDTAAPATSSAATAATASAAPGADSYVPVSDVAAHGAVGSDAARIRDLTAVAKKGSPVDWAAVGAVFTQGGASQRGDGSNRTLATLAESHPATAAVTAAIAGGASDAVRAQRVDKGITVILAAKVLDELAAAAKKVSTDDVAPKTGAPHNVDEAWAFFVAQEQGPALTADKRSKDFDRPLREPVLTALTAAQQAALAGDAAALTAATSNVLAGLNHVFYLGVHKYLAHEGDAVKQAEGLGFYDAVQSAVQAADPAADRAILATLAGGAANAGRQALGSDTVLRALGLSAAQRVTS